MMTATFFTTTQQCFSGQSNVRQRLGKHGMVGSNITLSQFNLGVQDGREVCFGEDDDKTLTEHAQEIAR